MLGTLTARGLVPTGRRDDEDALDPVSGAALLSPLQTQAKAITAAATVDALTAWVSVAPAEPLSWVVVAAGRGVAVRVWRSLAWAAAAAAEPGSPATHQHPPVTPDSARFVAHPTVAAREDAAKAATFDAANAALEAAVANAALEAALTSEGWAKMDLGSGKVRGIAIFSR
jgi:hypothetical protein